MNANELKARYAKFWAVVKDIRGLVSDLRSCGSFEQSDAVLEMKAVQICQTKHAGRGVLANAAQLEWAAAVCPDGYYPNGSSPTLAGMVNS